LAECGIAKSGNRRPIGRFGDQSHGIERGYVLVGKIEQTDVCRRRSAEQALQRVQPRRRVGATIDAHLDIRRVPGDADRFELITENLSGITGQVQRWRQG
jgi:hypothetical protein